MRTPETVESSRWPPIAWLFFASVLRSMTGRPSEQSYTAQRRTRTSEYSNETETVSGKARDPGTFTISTHGK